MIKRFLVIGHFLSVVILSYALVEEIKPPDEFLACLKVRMDKNDPSHTSYESLNNFCIASNRNKQTAKLEGPHLNISVETVNWINELLRMSEVDMHERAKRQAVNNDTIPIPPYLQFVFPSQFGSPMYPLSTGTATFTNQQTGSGQSVLQQQTINNQGQQTIVQPASVQQNPQNVQPIQNPQIPAQIPQQPQIFSQGTQNQVQGPQISSQGNFQIPALGAQIPGQQAAQIPGQQGVQIPAQQGVQIPAQQGVQIPAQQGIQIPAQQRIQIPAQQGVQIPAQQGVQIPAQQGAQMPGQGPVQQLGGQQGVQIPAQQGAQMPGQVPVQQFEQGQRQFVAPQQMVRPPQPPPRQLRVRKEYRRLTDQERARYHRAILMMKADTSVQPNRYDALGLIHFRMVDNIHHGGAFLAWHRIFISIYENALRQKVPDVTLPYFDSTMDQAMPDPTQSILFSPAFLGNGNGLVTSGPFAYWQTPSGPLIRNIGNPGGNLFSKDTIRAVLTRTRNAEILEPGASNAFNLENAHGDVHTWLGGQMEPMETSAFDPVFYMHHAFVDYVWEIFRGNQRRRGIDPTQDYPQNYGGQTHAPFTRTGFGNLVNGFGMSDMFTSEVYTYEPNPSCSFNNPNCGSNYLTCDISTGVPTCIPTAMGGGAIQQVRPMGAAGGFGGVGGPMLPGFMPNAFVVGRKKRSADKITKMRTRRLANTTSLPPSPFGTVTNANECSSTQLSYSSQNTFEIEGKSDTRAWVFIPVRIVSKRSPENQKFHAFPIYNGVAARDFDIYNPESYSEISSYFEDDMVPQSKRCGSSVGSSQTVGRVHIRSDGLNYRGTYDEYVIVDLRQAFMESTTYIALRSPEQEYSEVLISAYDSCGRKCRAFCRNEEGDLSEFHECAGSIRVTQQEPYGYGKNYGAAIDMSWNIKNATNIPEFKNDSVNIQFFCDHHEY